MKSINSIAALILISIPFIGFGQTNQDKPVKKMRISDFYVHTGMSFQTNVYGSILDYRALAPQSDLTTDLSGSNLYRTSIVSGRTSLSIMMGIQFSDKEKSFYKANPKLRLGFTFSPGKSFYGGSFKENRFPFDTLVSSQTGENIYIDSVITESNGVFYNSDQIRLNASLIFSTNPEKRWALYSGIGVTAGISLNQNTTVSYSKNGRTDEVQAINPNMHSNITGYSTTYESISESYRNKTNFGFSAYIPVGVDFRIGNKREFWKRTHLFFEFQPAVDVTSVPELKTYTNLRFNSGLGLRVNF